MHDSWWLTLCDNRLPTIRLQVQVLARHCCVEAVGKLFTITKQYNFGTGQSAVMLYGSKVTVVLTESTDRQAVMSLAARSALLSTILTSSTALRNHTIIHYWHSPRLCTTIRTDHAPTQIQQKCHHRNNTM